MKRKYQFVAALLIVLFTVSMGLTTLYLRTGKAQER